MCRCPLFVPYTKPLPTWGWKNAAFTLTWLRRSGSQSYVTLTTGCLKNYEQYMWQLESLLFSFFIDNRGKKFSIVFLNFAKGKLGIVPSLRLMDFLCQSAGRFVPQPETIFVKNYQTSITTSWIFLSLLSSVPYLMHTVINPIHPNISMHILHTVLYTFPWVMTKRICLTINSFLLFDSGVIM